MDKGRRLTIQQKRRRQRLMISFAVFPILDFAFWICLGRPKILLLIGCVSAVNFVMSCVYLGIYYGLLLILERDGNMVSYRINRRLEILFCSALFVSVVFAGYLLYKNLPELNALFCRMINWIPVPEIQLDIALPEVNFSLSDLRLDFWHISVALVCLGAVIISFCSNIWCGIITAPVMAAYGILFWRACDGNYPQDFAAYLELLKYALIIMLVSGILLWDFTGFVWLLTTVRFLVPFTFLCIIAILLQDADPLGSPPVNFRAVLFWVLSLVFFAAQSLQLFRLAVPDYAGPDRPDDPVGDQSGDEYDDSYWR